MGIFILGRWQNDSAVNLGAHLVPKGILRHSTPTNPPRENCVEPRTIRKFKNLKTD